MCVRSISIQNDANVTIYSNRGGNWKLNFYSSAGTMCPNCGKFANHQQEATGQFSCGDGIFISDQELQSILDKTPPCNIHYVKNVQEMIEQGCTMIGLHSASHIVFYYVKDGVWHDPSDIVVTVNDVITAVSKFAKEHPFDDDIYKIEYFKGS